MWILLQTMNGNHVCFNKQYIKCVYDDVTSTEDRPRCIIEMVNGTGADKRIVVLGKYKDIIHELMETG